jgi:hypothetical protein
VNAGSRAPQWLAAGSAPPMWPAGAWLTEVGIPGTWRTEPGETPMGTGLKATRQGSSPLSEVTALKLFHLRTPYIYIEF